MHERPEKAIGKLAIVTVHVLGVEKDKPHVKVVSSKLEMHSAVTPYLDMRKMIRRVFRTFHLFEQSGVVSSGHIDIVFSH